MVTDVNFDFSFRGGSEVHCRWKSSQSQLQLKYPYFILGLEVEPRVVVMVCSLLVFMGSKSLRGIGGASMTTTTTTKYSSFMHEL